MLQIELSSGPRWSKEHDWEAMCLTAANAAISASPYGNLLAKPFALEISFSLTGNAEVQKLNAQYRQKDKPTNVLSFPLVQKDMLSGLANTDDGEILLGDIILAHGVCSAEAEDKSVTLPHHVSHLVVHGTLHLLGYDHEQESEAIIMEELETLALAAIGIADPYADRNLTDENQN